MFPSQQIFCCWCYFSEIHSKNNLLHQVVKLCHNIRWTIFQGLNLSCSVTLVHPNEKIVYTWFACWNQLVYTFSLHTEIVILTNVEKWHEGWLLEYAWLYELSQMMYRYHTKSDLTLDLIVDFWQIRKVNIYLLFSELYLIKQYLSALYLYLVHFAHCTIYVYIL